MSKHVPVRTRRAVAASRLRMIAQYMALHDAGFSVEDAVQAMEFSSRQRLRYFRHIVRKSHSLCLPTFPGERGGGAVKVVAAKARREQPATEPAVADDLWPSNLSFVIQAG